MIWFVTLKDFFSSVIEDNHGNQRVLFQAINSLLHKKAELHYPAASSDTNLVDQFNSFFNDKVRPIREALPQPITYAAYSTVPSISCQCELTSFDRFSTAYIATVLKSCKVQSCTLDPFPASVLSGCLPDLLPVITDLVNSSLDTAFIPVALTTALITPHLKKSNLNSDDFKNFRPVSNLPFISKVIEKVATVQIMLLITLMIIISVNLYNQPISATIDAVDRGTLIHRLEFRFGIKGKALQ